MQLECLCGRAVCAEGVTQAELQRASREGLRVERLPSVSASHSQPVSTHTHLIATALLSSPFSSRRTRILSEANVTRDRLVTLEGNPGIFQTPPRHARALKSLTTTEGRHHLKLIVGLRDPFDLAFSLWSFLSAIGQEGKRVELRISRALAAIEACNDTLYQMPTRLMSLSAEELQAYRSAACSSTLLQLSQHLPPSHHSHHSHHSPPLPYPLQLPLHTGRAWMTGRAQSSTSISMVACMGCIY